MYPRLRDGASLKVYINESSETKYFAENEWNERVEISYRVYKELLLADGTRPIHISKSLLDELKNERILTTSRFVFEGIISRFILIPFGKNLARFQPICRWINVMLPLLAVSLFAVSVFVKQRCDHSVESNLNLCLFYVLILTSVFLHEVGHCIAGIACGYSPADLSLLLLGILPIGACLSYVDEQKGVSRLARLQFNLVGIEINILIAGVFLLLATKSSPLDTTFAMAANINLFLMLLNLLPASGMDGESAINTCLGKEIREDAKKFLTSRTFRREKLTSGRSGYGCIAVYAIYYISSVAVGLLIAADILVIVLKIFW